MTLPLQQSCQENQEDGVLIIANLLVDEGIGEMTTGNVALIGDTDTHGCGEAEHERYIGFDLTKDHRRLNLDNDFKVVFPKL